MIAKSVCEHTPQRANPDVSHVLLLPSCLPHTPATLPAHDLFITTINGELISIGLVHTDFSSNLPTSILSLH